MPTPPQSSSIPFLSSLHPALLPVFLVPAEPKYPLRWQSRAWAGHKTASTFILSSSSHACFRWFLGLCCFDSIWGMLPPTTILPPTHPHPHSRPIHPPAAVRPSQALPEKFSYRSNLYPGVLQGRCIVSIRSGACCHQQPLYPRPSGQYASTCPPSHATTHSPADAHPSQAPPQKFSFRSNLYSGVLQDLLVFCTRRF